MVPPGRVTRMAFRSRPSCTRATYAMNRSDWFGALPPRRRSVPSPEQGASTRTRSKAAFSGKSRPSTETTRMLG